MPETGDQSAPKIIAIVALSFAVCDEEIVAATTTPISSTAGGEPLGVVGPDTDCLLYTSDAADDS